MPDIRAQDEKALASVKAIYDAAEQAKNDAQRAHDAADEAEGHAQTALTNAATAKAAADEAQEAADKSLVQLSIIEDVAGTLNWIQEHGTYKATTDTTVQEGKIYFVKNGDDYEPVVNPAGDPHSQGWYVLDLSDSQSDYIMAHLAVTSRGLWVLPSGMGSASDAQYAPNYKALLSSSGLLIYDGDGALVSTFGENISFSATRGQRIGGTNNYIEFDPATGRINIIGSGVYIGTKASGDLVAKDNVIASINASTETSGGSTVKIAADKVEINGTAVFSAIKSSADAAYDAKGAASDAVDNLQVGGRNLVRALDETKMTVTKSGCSYTYDNGTYVIRCTTAGGGSNFTQIYGVTSAMAPSFNNVSAGETVIFHVDSVESSNTASEPRIYLDLRKSDGTYISSMGIYQSLNGWTRTFQIPAETARYTLLIRMDQNRNAAVGDTLTVSGIKLEKGNKATDWTPAPEDVQADINAKKSTWNLMSTSASGAAYQDILDFSESTTTYTIDNSASGFDKATDVKVGDTVRLKYKATDMGSGGTYVYIIGKATQVPPTVADNKITLAGRGLDTTVIDGGHILTGTIDANKVNVSNLTVGSAQSGWGNVLNDNIEVGGRNLLKEFDIWVNATTSGVTRAYTSNGWHKFSGTLSLTANSRHALYCGPSFGRTVIAGPGTYTITNWTENLELNSNIYIRVYMYKNDGGTLTNPHNYNVTASNTSKTFTVEDGEYIAAVVLFFMTASSGTSLDNAKLRLKLEKGNKATDWTPAPEDIESADGRNYAKTNAPIGTSSTSNGITATLTDYGTVTLNGTSTNAFVVLPDGLKAFGGLTLSVGAYKIWFTNTNGTNMWCRIGKGTSAGYMYSVEGEYTKDSPFLLNVTEENIYYVGIAVKSGATFSNFTTSIMWERCQTTDFSPAPEDTKNVIALSSRNMLLDWNAPSLDRVDSSSGRYYINEANTSAYVTRSFVSISDAPEPSIRNGVRFVGNGTNTSTASTGLAFYGATNLNVLPFKAGCAYTFSFWARCTSGSGRIAISVRQNGGTWTDVVPNSTTLTSDWKRYYGVLNYIPNTDYNRVAFYVHFNANTSGTVEMCGFQCVANGDSAEATSYITSIDSDNGIRVHAANNPTTNYAKIDATGMEVYKGGNKVAKFGQTIELSDGTRTLYEVKPLSGAAKVTRLYNLAYYDGYTERETYTETVHLGRTVSSWSSIILAYKINSTSYTKSYSSFPVSDASGKFTLDISYADSSNAKVNVGINANTTLASTETLTIESLTFNYATTQVAIESTLGAFADKTQSAAFRVGNGTATNATSNSFSLDWAGNGYFNGDIYANCNANSSGGVSLGTVQYIPGAFNADTTEYYMDIGVFRIGMVVMLDISFFRNKSIAAGGNIFNLDISRSDVPMPQTGVATGMAFYNNGTSSRALGIVLGDTDGTGPRIRVYNNGTNAVTISSTQEVHCTMTYICDTFTAAHWDEV